MTNGETRLPVPSYKIILKTTCKHVDRVRNCARTWLQGKDYVCLTDNLTGEFNELSASSRTDYYSAEEKTAHLFNQVLQHGLYREYDWLVLLDDDAILNTRMFEYILPHLDLSRFYGLAMARTKPEDPDFLFPSGGAGYLFSPGIIKSPFHKHDIGLEDVAVGYWLQENGIPIHRHFDANGKKCVLRLNGWFPFVEEKKKLGIDDRDNLALLVEARRDPDIRKRVMRCMTHHYITNYEMMKYVHDVYQTFMPDDLEFFAN